MKPLFKKILFLIFVVLVSDFLVCQTNPIRKNVLLIMVDDMNDWVEPFGGHPQAKTPNLKAFAEKAVVFQAASCASPVCNPSRTAMLTGRRGHETGITNNTFEGSKQNFRQSSQTWVKNLITLPQYFSQSGYETVNQGKIFHTHNFDPISWSVVGPGGQGCNAGSIVGSVANTDLDWSEWVGQLSNTGDFKSANYCANYLSTSHNKPFFLACGIFRPHLPFHAPKQYYDLFPLNSIQLPEGYKENDLSDIGKNLSQGELTQVKASGKWKEVVRAYLANLAFADACVGHLLSKLAASPYAQNTIVVIAGDHGWHLGEKEHFHKYTLWERAVKTPLLIYDPSIGVKGNCAKAVSLQDIYPTLVDLCAIPQPSFTIRGRSLKPLLQNPNAASWNGAALCSYGPGHHSLRSDQYRYIRMSNGDEELYDIVTDKWEFTNLARSSTHSTQLSKMRKALNDMLAHNENPFGNATTDPVPLVSLTVTPVLTNSPAIITLEAIASDNGSIAKVEFYNGNVLIGSKTSIPYSMIWNQAASGSFSLSTRAYDNAGGIGISTPVIVQINGDGNITDINDLNAIVQSCTKVNLNWSDKTFETGYRIRRKLLQEATYTNLADLPANTISYADNTVVAGNSYVYMVRPISNGTSSGISNTPEVTIPECLRNRVADSDPVQVFPNPFHNEFVFTYSNEFNLEEVVLTDVSGKSIRVKAEKIDENRFRISSDRLPSGWYFISIQGTTINRVFKQ